MMHAPIRDRFDRPVTEFMRRDFVALRADQSVAEALESLRGHTLGERIVYFYVVDHDERLVGVVATRRLLMSTVNRRVEQIMHTAVASVPTSADLLQACEQFLQRRLLALPVVDGDSRLVGVLDALLFSEQMVDLSERQATDDVFQLIGVRLAQNRELSAWGGFRKRFPWLMCNVAGGTTCPLLAGMYEAFLDAVIVLALFIPVVLAIAESVSMQSMTLSIQAMHGQSIDWRYLWRATRREFLTAVLLGAGAGAVVGLVALIWNQVGLVALAIGVTIWLSVITACVLGVVLPVGVRAFRGDPRIAAGPVVLAAADVLTLLLYFNLAGLLLHEVAGMS